MKNLTVTLSLVCLLPLAGCSVSSAVIDSGNNRSVVRSLNDTNASRAIKARMLRSEGYDLSGVDVEVAEGIVLLSGQAPTQEDRIEAERIAWSAPNIFKVGNEISEKDGQGFFGNTKDAYLKNAVRTRMIADKTVHALNYNIETHSGRVYLLGIAGSSEELERAAQIASTTDGTKEVISYVRIKGNPIQSAGFVPPSAKMTAPQALPPVSGPSITSDPIPPLAGGSAEALPETEPYYVDPQTGERVILPPGTKTVPYNPDLYGDESPFYIDPDTGEQIQVVYQTTID